MTLEDATIELDHSPVIKMDSEEHLTPEDGKIITIDSEYLLTSPDVYDATVRIVMR